MRIAHTSMPWTPLSPSIHSQLDEMNRFINSVYLLVAIIASSSSLFAQAATTPSESSAAIAQSLLEAFSASLAAGNTTSSEDLVSRNLDKLRSALSSLNITLPAAANSSSLSSLANIIQSFLASESSSNTYLPLVKAASGLADSLLSGSTSITSFNSQLADLKKRYQAALKYLHTDDAVRIGGYLLTLDSLALQAISAYPIAEASLFVAELSLCSAITGLVGGILYTVSTALGLSGSIISLQLTLQAAFPTGTHPNGPRSTADTTMIQSNNMLNALTLNADAVTRELLPFVLGGGMTSPLALATDVLTSSASSLDRLSNFAAPQAILNRFNLLQLQVQSGPFAQAISAAANAGSGRAIGSVAAAAANLAGGLGGRRSMQTV